MRDGSPANQRVAYCNLAFIGLSEELCPLEVSINDGLRIQLEPVFKDGRVDRPEVKVELQGTTLLQLRRLQGRLGPINATLNVLTYSESHSSGAVVGTRTVIDDAATKFTEEK